VQNLISMPSHAEKGSTTSDEGVGVALIRKMRPMVTRLLE
jgi:hypothetical protein